MSTITGPTPLALRLKMAWAVLRDRSVMNRMEVNGDHPQVVHPLVDLGGYVTSSVIHGMHETGRQPTGRVIMKSAKVTWLS